MFKKKSDGTNCELFFRSPLLSFFYFFVTGASRDARETRERARTSESRGHRAGPRPTKKKRHPSKPDRWRPASLAFLSYLEERVQTFDLDHPPVACEVGPVARGAVAGGGLSLRRSSGGHRGREKGGEEGKKRKDGNENGKKLDFFFFLRRAKRERRA